MPHSYYQIWVHLVWAIHLRQTILTKPIRIILWEHIRNISEEKSYHLDTINGVEDHVHCLYSLRPTQNISKLVKDIKGESSNWINANKIAAVYFKWQEGYSAFSVSYKDVQIVRQYIYTQEEHHKEKSYETELLNLNNKPDF